MSLTAQDRCDACGAAAHVTIESPVSGLQLNLCAHHLRKYENGVGQWLIVASA